MRALIGLLVACIPAVASAQTKPNHQKTVGPWEIVQWVRGATITRCTLIRDKKPANAPSYGFLIDSQGLLLSVETTAWQLTPDAKVRARLMPAGAAARNLTVVPASAARANIDFSKDRALLGDLQRADRLDVAIGAVTVTLPFDGFSAARAVLESCVTTLGKTVAR